VPGVLVGVGVTPGVGVAVGVGLPDGVPVGVGLAVSTAKVNERVQVPGVGVAISAACGMLEGTLGATGC